ncbi:restriction endonuclease subunit S [Myroides odoratimimus]|uniref:restriction endonuclease subunit S n=1 Tax=Myroides odoratimimus TaxID=76832 RepID=UPI002DBAC382|nr:restriction endonuclease subunit S [Myroides odoratimimus]MEC4077014.1 restriction endonuclease subunit S [Myroides odoratimimus]
MRFPEFEGEWETKKLGEVATNKSEKYNPANETGSIKCIEMEHLATDTGQLLGYIDGSTSGSIKNVFNEGDVLFGKLRPYLKKYLQAPFDGVCSSEIWVLKGKNISNDFLYRIVQTKLFIDLANQSSGSKMPRADWNVVESGFFCIPTLLEQEKISSFLLLIDERIQTQNKIIEELSVLKNCISKKLFSQELRFKDDNEEKFPEWKETKLGDVLNIQGGFAFKSNSFNQGTTKVLRIGDIEPRIKLAKFSGIYSNEKPDKKYIVKKNDFVMALSGATFGKVGKILDDDYAFINQRVALFRTKNCLDFFYQLVLTEKFKNYINSIPAASAQPNISNNDITNYITVIPVITEQIQIAKSLSSIDSKIDIEFQLLQKLEEQKKYLLDNLFV